MTGTKQSLKKAATSRLNFAGRGESGVRGRLVTTFQSCVDNNHTPDLMLSEFLENLHDFYKPNLSGQILFDGDNHAPHSCLDAMTIAASEIDTHYHGVGGAKKLLAFTSVFRSVAEESANTKVLFARNGAEYYAQAAVFGLDYYQEMQEQERANVPYQDAVDEIERSTPWRETSDLHRQTFTLIKNAYAHALLSANSFEIQQTKQRAQFESSQWAGHDARLSLP